MRTDLDLEVWLAERASRPHLQRVFDGITNAAERARRMRDLILSQNLADAPAGGVNRGTPKTFRECFEKIYSEAL